MLNTLTKRDYNKTDTTKEINRAITIPRDELLSKIKTSNTERLPLTVRYNRTLRDSTNRSSNHVLPDQLISVINKSKLAQPSKVPLTKAHKT